MRLKHIAIAVTLFLETGIAQDRTVTIQHGGRGRTYVLHVPRSYDGTQAMPLVLDFHGLGSSASGQAFLSGFRSLSDRQGFLVAWPQGIGNSWNAGACCGTAQRYRIDDVGFARAVAAHVRSTHRVDARRVYVTGLSNGGAMTHRLASEAADVFAAAAVFAGLLVTPVQPSRPIALISFHGYSDGIVPYSGAPRAIRVWSQADQCQAGPATTIITGSNKCETWSSCQGGVEVSLCSIQGGHVIYRNTPNLNLAERAWGFLSRYSLPDTLVPAEPAPRPASRASGSAPADYLPDGRRAPARTAR